MVVVRDFLAACTLVKATPWTSAEIDSVRRLCADRQLTPVYFAGIQPEELNRPDQLPGPPGTTGDWLHYALGLLFASRDEELFEDWPFEIRPATDRRPFFSHFGKLDSIGILRQSFGSLWLTRTELGLLFVFAAQRGRCPERGFIDRFAHWAGAGDSSGGRRGGWWRPTLRPSGWLT